MKIAQPATIFVYIPLYLGIEGTEHTLTSYGTADKAIAAVSKGEADISIGDPFMFNYLNYKEKDVVIIAAFIRRVLHSLITFNPFLQRADEATLQGKSIVCYPEPSTSFFLAQQLKKKYELGELLQTPFNTELGPLLTEEADVAVVLEPNATYALHNGAKELLDFSREAAVTTGFCMHRPQYMKKKKEVQAFLSLVKKGIDIFKEDPTKTESVAQKYFPLVHPTILKAALARIRNRDYYCEDFTFTDEEIERGLALRDIDLSVKEARKLFIRGL